MAKGKSSNDALPSKPGAAPKEESVFILARQSTTDQSARQRPVGEAPRVPGSDPKHNVTD